MNDFKFIIFFYLVSLGKKFKQLRMETAKCTDERIHVVNEIVPAMRVIKMYAWEKAFANQIDLCRRFLHSIDFINRFR